MTTEPTGPPTAVTICGPNLPRPLSDQGDMHAHAAGCADLRRYPTGADQGGWTIEVASLRALTLEVYGDQLAESDDPANWRSYLGEIRVYPCVHLPELAAGEHDGQNRGDGGSRAECDHDTIPPPACNDPHVIPDGPMIFCQLTEGHTGSHRAAHDGAAVGWVDGPGLHRVPISNDLRARIIANAWHGGQGSYLYALASTGAITLADGPDDDGDPRGEGVDQELRQVITEAARPQVPADPYDTPPDPQGAAALTWLAGYVAHAGERGPVDGWAAMGWDGGAERRQQPGSQPDLIPGVRDDLATAAGRMHQRGADLTRLTCKTCGQADTARSIEEIAGSCDILGLDWDGAVEFYGETEIYWDSSTTVAYECSRCLIPGELADLFDGAEGAARVHQPTEAEQHQAEAGKQLASRLADMRRFIELGNNDDEDEGHDEDLGSVDDYGLDWALAITDHQAGTVEYVHVLSTGGPHEEFRVTFTEERAGYVEPTKVTFVSLPWFGRVEVPLEGDDLNVALAFYETFYADGLVSMGSIVGDSDR